jgi:hypothetical protein
MIGRTLVTRLDSSGWLKIDSTEELETNLIGVALANSLV